MKLRLILTQVLGLALFGFGYFYLAPLFFSGDYLLAGVIVNGIMGPVSGKVGGVVGADWKGINYLKAYTKPANPNTASQQTVRTKFAAMVAFSQQLLPTLIPFAWDPFAVKMSGFNYWIKENYDLVDGSNLITANNVMSKGTLAPVAITTMEYNTAVPDVEVAFDGTIYGNGLATDKVSVVVVNNDDGKIYTNLEDVQRDDGSAICVVPAGLTSSDLFGFIFASRGTGPDFIVSDSDGQVCVDA